MSPPGRVLAETVAFHRDPLGVLRRARARQGPVFDLQLVNAGTVVVVADPAAARDLLEADPTRAHAGEARRRILPFASERSSFGGDGERHRAARAAPEAALAPSVVDPRRAAMAAIAEEHVATWPRGRPFRVLPRMRALLDDVTARLFLGVADEDRARAIAAAVQRMLRTPGNPPVVLPGQDGRLGDRAAWALFDRRRAPLAALLRGEIERLRADGGAALADGAGGAGLLGAAVSRAPGASAQEVADELLPVLMAAQEPPAVALTWVADRAARAPEVADHLAATGPEGLDPLGDAVVRETLRLRPPALAALRRLLEPLEVAGRRLEAGTVVAVPIPLLHRDPRAFPEPERFRPDRWLGAERPEVLFLPFGGGARRCVGEHLAQAHFAAVLPAVLRRVRLRPVRPRPERMVVRATTLVPHRSGLAIAHDR